MQTLDTLRAEYRNLRNAASYKYTATQFDARAFEMAAEHCHDSKVTPAMRVAAARSIVASFGYEMSDADVNDLEARDG